MKKPEPAPWVRSIPPYVPGLSKEEIARQHGIAKPIKLASNENPLGPSPLALAAIERVRQNVHLYPDPSASELRQAAARYFGCLPEEIIAGNGSDEIIDFICRAFLSPGDEVLIPECTFSYYQIAALACGATVVRTPMDGMHIDASAIEQALTGHTRVKLIFLANPNNPTGTYLGRERLSHLVSITPPETILVVDEAYSVFARAADYGSALDMIRRHDNIIIVNTLSKSHGLAGMRVGFGLASRYLIDTLWRIKPPFNLNLPAITAGAAALGDSAFLKQTLALTWEGLDYLYQACARLGLDTVESQTNFVLVHIGREAQKIYEGLLARGIITRYISGSGLAEYLRISIGLPEENHALVAHLEELFSG